LLPAKINLTTLKVLYRLLVRATDIIISKAHISQDDSTSVAAKNIIATKPKRRQKLTHTLIIIKVLACIKNLTVETAYLALKLF
jgi:hypothetical protein